MDNNKMKILVIDDEISPRESIKLVLKDKYAVTTASGGPEGLEFMSQNPVDLLVLDIMMPDMDGIAVLEVVKEKYPDIEVILLTAYASLETAKSAIRFGAFDYLTKPFDKDDILNAVERGLEKKRNNDNMRAEKEELLSRTINLEGQISKARESITMSYKGTVKALILTIDAKDHYTFSHSEHVSRLSSLIADVLDVPRKVKKRLELAASMHDIGKIGVDETILKKNGRLTPEEFQEIKKHPEIGATIVKQVPFLEDAIPVILYHHERYDGKGYPERITGEDIPLTARIVMVADAIDSMLHARPYRNSLPMTRVLYELESNAGTQFDPTIVDIILKGKIPLK